MNAKPPGALSVTTASLVGMFSDLTVVKKLDENRGDEKNVPAIEWSPIIERSTASKLLSGFVKLGIVKDKTPGNVN